MPLSNSTANCLETLYPDDAEMQDGAAFIRLIDTWFDTFNSFVKIDPRKWAKSAFRTNLEKSKELLKNVIFTISNLKVRTKRVMMFWQKAIVGDCHALLMLYDDFTGHYEIYYLLTSRYALRSTFDKNL